MCNVQTEALEVEFQEFSSGSSAITPVDFARIILRYTTVSASEYDAFINRLEKAVPPNIVRSVYLTYNHIAGNNLQRISEIFHVFKLSG